MRAANAAGADRHRHRTISKKKKEHSPILPIVQKIVRKITPIPRKTTKTTFQFTPRAASTSENPSFHRSVAG